jgi:hypothetical protein
MEEEAPAASKEEFLKEMDEKKLALLKQRDFSYLEPAVEFQDVIEKVLKSKKNQLTLKSLIKSCRVIIISLTVVNFFTVVSGIALVYVKNVSSNDGAAEKIFYIWLTLLVLSVILGIVYFIKSIKIEGLKND